MPAVLRLAQSVMHRRWRAMGEELYREMAMLARARVGVEVLVSGCKDGVTAVWLSARTGAAVTGIDPDAGRIARAETRARAAAGVAPSYEVAPLDDLPHENDVFDAAIGEPSIASALRPARAVAELARVTRPMGHVVTLVPTWSSELPLRDRESMVERLALRPYLLVEWKQMMRDAGVVEIVVQDWSDGGPAARTGGSMPAVPQLTWRQKAHVAARAFRRRGLQAARTSVQRESELLQELARARAIGFHLISGVKWPRSRES